MQNGFYQVTGAMVTQFEQLNVTSNNLANVNTSGFKRDGVIIGDFERLYQTKRDELAHPNHTEKAAKFFNRSVNRVPSIVENVIDFSQGSIKETNNSLDFALQGGDLFFAVKTPDGVRLTQQSSFVINADGVLSTKEGWPLLSADFQNSEKSEIRLPKGTTLLANDKGELFAGEVKKSSLIGQLFVGRVKELKNMQKEGEKLYKLPDMQNQLKQMDGANLVKQGYVVMSNVNAVKEMTSLIETSRLVEMYQKVMTAHMDDLNQDAISKLAATRA